MPDKTPPETLRYHARCRTIATGISDDAWNVITSLFDEDLPLFQFFDFDPSSGKSSPRQFDAQSHALMAAQRDGQRIFLRKLRAMRRLGKSL